MKTLEMHTAELDELNVSDLIDVNGGFGSYPGCTQASLDAGKVFWNAVGEFVDGFRKGFNDSYRG